VYNIYNERETPKQRKRDTKMSLQEIFEMLSDNECKLFYAYCTNPTDEMKAAHAAAKAALESFAKTHNCHN
jgi:hypothetical protein